MQIELSKQIVEIKEDLGFWDFETLKSTMSSGLVLGEKGEVKGLSDDGLLKIKRKALEIYILTIKDKETEKQKTFSDEWLFSLSKEDGDKLSEALELEQIVQKISEVKKKKKE